jgi:hypothetical protein
VSLDELGSRGGRRTRADWLTAMNDWFEGRIIKPEWLGDIGKNVAMAADDHRPPRDLKIGSLV